MNNQLKKTFDSHNNATIIESKPNTKFGFCMFLQNKGGFKIQTSLRHSHIGENDNYFGLDFRIDSDTLYNLFPLEECYLSFIVDGKITKLSIAHQLIGRGEKMNNFSYQVWFTVPIYRDLLMAICNSESLELRINTQIGFIDVNFEDLDTKKDFILMSRHFYNGVYEISEFNEDIKTNINSQKNSSSNFINYLKSPIAIVTYLSFFLFIVLPLIFYNIVSDKINVKNNEKQFELLEGNWETLNKNWKGKDFNLFISKYGDPISSFEYTDVHIKGGDKYLKETTQDLEKIRKGKTNDLKTVKETIYIEYYFNDLFTENFSDNKVIKSSVYVTVEKESNKIMKLKKSSFQTIMKK